MLGWDGALDTGMVGLGIAEVATFQATGPMHGACAQRLPVTALRAKAVSHAENDDPQPQEPFEFGLLNLKPAPCSPST